MRLRNVLSFPFRDRQLRLMHDRKGATPNDFCESFEGEFERAVAKKTLDYLQEFVMVDSFIPALDDSLLDIYGIADEELNEDILLQFLNDFDISIPSQQAVDEFGEVNTPRRVVEFVSFARNLQA